jgi:hypothetical protein
VSSVLCLSPCSGPDTCLKRQLCGMKAALAPVGIAAPPEFAAPLQIGNG